MSDKRLFVLLVPVALLCSCGSSGSPKASAAARDAVCEQVTAASSDGPDPGADPVGHAEAQILPLRQIHTSDAQLQTAIDRLAAAYAKFYASDGKAADQPAVRSASAAVESICPGST